MAKVIPDYLDDAYKFHPDKIAFEDKQKKITYRQLYEEAQTIAHVLKEKNIYHQPVFVLLSSCVECAVFMYAIGYSGNYLTISDYSLGKKPTLEILEVLNPSVILTDNKGQEILNTISADYLIYTYDELIDNYSFDNKNYISLALDRDLFLMCYTSGSTGKPKGTVHSHNSLIEGVNRYCEVLKLNKDARIAEFSANMYGIFYMNLCNTVYSCAYEYMFSQEEKFILGNAFKTIRRLKLNRISCISVLLEMARQQKCLEEENINCIEVIAFVGAPISYLTVNYWRDKVDGIILRQYYGATEAIMEAYFEIDRYFKEGETIPIGKGFHNNELIILGTNNGQLESGEEGEMYVRSSTLAIGYYKDPEKTQSVFVQNPLHNNFPDIVFKTGDYVKKNKDGDLIFLGRADSMVKRHGYRIELGEIDAKLSSVEGINECVSLFKKESEKIVTFYEGNRTEAEIFCELKEILRPYVMPDRIIKLDKIPHGDNYKIDRKQLYQII